MTISIHLSIVFSILLHVGCDGVVGSGRVLDACGVCGGGNSSCRLVSGIFTEPRLQPGYNTVAQLPAGACRIQILELGATKNYLALRDVRGEYIINGDWNIDNSGSYSAAGALFVYRRQSAGSGGGASAPASEATAGHGDAITADGPITEPVDIVLLYQEINRGIKYEYAIKHEASLQSVLPRLPSGTIGQSSAELGQAPGTIEHSALGVVDGLQGGGRTADVHPTPPTALPSSDTGSFMSPLYQPRRSSVGSSGQLSPTSPHSSSGGRHINQLNDASVVPPRPPDSALKYPYSKKRDPYVRGADPYSRTLDPYGRNRDYYSNRDPFRRLGPTIEPTLTVQPPRAVGSSNSGRAVSKSRGANRTRHRRRRRHRFHWLVRGLTECSRSCGGGTQLARVLCVRRKRKQQVRDSRCDARRRPRTAPRSCNTQPCPAQWQASEWSPCSVTCGSGSQTAAWLCMKDDRPVSSAECKDREPLKQANTRPCHLQPCPVEAKWHVAEWGQCSVSCGWGSRIRDVTCTAHDASLCPEADRPRNRAPCEMSPCPAEPPLTAQHRGQDDSNWMVTEWSEQCSVQCGQGVQWRSVVCGAGRGHCHLSQKPPETRACKTDRACGGSWFTGPWSQCSRLCGGGGGGAGVARRAVVCVRQHEDRYAIVSDLSCARQPRPDAERPCGQRTHLTHPDCVEASWFVGTWGACSATCGPGSQSRTVACVEANGRRSGACRPEEAPAARRHCTLAQCPRTGDNYHMRVQFSLSPDPELRLLYR